MSRRDELAEKILLALLSNSSVIIKDGADVRGSSFCIADAFLARCEPETSEQPGAMPEPDAVWTVMKRRDYPGEDEAAVRQCGVWLNDNFPATEFGKILAGRERVRLRVYVEEVEA